jgi:hypothetical protein
VLTVESGFDWCPPQDHEVRVRFSSVRRPRAGALRRKKPPDASAMHRMTAGVQLQGVPPKGIAFACSSTFGDIGRGWRSETRKTRKSC